jgi:hypothetical protein
MAFRRNALQLFRLVVHFLDRFTECADLIFFMRRRYRDAQSCGSFGDRWVTNRRDKESFAF